jgi:hypothetical protein
MTWFMASPAAFAFSLSSHSIFFLIAEGHVMGSQQAASMHLSWVGPSRPMRYCSGALQ